MKILALEFSTLRRSVAIVESQAGSVSATSKSLLAAAAADDPQPTGPFSLIEQALEQASLRREDLDCLAVGLGPGSYAGIRVAIAVAQGWQLARPVHLLGISSVEALAARAQAEGITGRTHIAVDAQRGEFYLASYDLSPAGWREIAPLQLASREELQIRCRVGGVLLSPDAPSAIPEARAMFPEAATLGMLAAGRRDFVRGEQLEPIYLRAVSFVKAPPPRTFPDLP